MLKYEIESVRWPDLGGHAETIGTLTGLEKHEVAAAIKNLPDSWGGQLYIKVFRKLGFNTNPRFVKFDPETKWPCIMRFQSRNKGHWYAMVYYDHHLYFEGCKINWEQHVRKLYGKLFFIDGTVPLKITSMLQVWI